MIELFAFKIPIPITPDTKLGAKKIQAREPSGNIARQIQEVSNILTLNTK